MIFIYKELARNFISKLTIDDLKKYGDRFNLKFDGNELLVVYQFIKYHYIDLLEEKIEVFQEIKDKINPVLYKKLLNIYIDYKQKYL